MQGVLAERCFHEVICTVSQCCLDGASLFTYIRVYIIPLYLHILIYEYEYMYVYVYAAYVQVDVYVYVYACVCVFQSGCCLPRRFGHGCQG